MPIRDESLELQWWYYLAALGLILAIGCGIALFVAWGVFGLHGAMMQLAAGGSLVLLLICGGAAAIANRSLTRQRRALELVSLSRMGNRERRRLRNRSRMGNRERRRLRNRRKPALNNRQRAVRGNDDDSDRDD